MDGNKRSSLVACELFLALNGRELTMEDTEAVMTWFALASGEMGEEGLAERIRRAMAPVEGD